MTEKNKSGLKVVKGANNAQEQKTIKTAAKPTLEQLQKENAELKKQLSAIPSDLETKIEYFNKKKELIRKLTLLSDNKEELNTHISNLSEIAAENDFENDRYFVSIKDKRAGSYRDENVFQIKNPDIIGDVLTFIVKRIEDKETKLRKEIEA